MFGSRRWQVEPARPRKRIPVPLVVLFSISSLVVAASCTALAEVGDAAGENHDPDSGPATASETGSAGGRPATLVRVIDGDSLEVEIEGEEVEVRLQGMNAPELYGPEGRRAGEEPTCNGDAAKSALSLLLEDEELAVIGSETDRFGRLLADVRAGDRSTVVDMVELGWGLATGSDNDGLRAGMKQAAADRVGLWGDLCGTPQISELVIGEAQVDPQGSDRENLNDEWVTVVNEGSQTVDLTGWVIRDDTTGHRYPMAAELQANGVLTVRSGAGTSTDSDMFLDETFPVWSNGGETVLLVDPAGVVVAWAFIDADGNRS